MISATQFSTLKICYLPYKIFFEKKIPFSLLTHPKTENVLGRSFVRVSREK
jgi:hypothetical protein